MGFVKHWNSDDWTQAAGIATAVAGAVAAPFTGGWSLIATGAGAALTGYSAYEEASNETKAAQREAATQAQQEWRESEIQRKTSLLAAQNTMTARQAMARNISAALKGMYSPKISNTSPTPQTLGGDSQTLG